MFFAWFVDLTLIFTKTNTKYSSKATAQTPQKKINKNLAVLSSRVKKEMKGKTLPLEGFPCNVHLLDAQHVPSGLCTAEQSLVYASPGL